MDDRKKIGLGLIGFGVFFSFLGIMLFFDKGLLAIGNILFISGVIMTIGIKSTLQFFMKRSNFKGTVSFGIGFFFVIIGWPVIGMAIEAYGFLILFRFCAEDTGCKLSVSAAFYYIVLGDIVEKGHLYEINPSVAKNYAGETC